MKKRNRLESFSNDPIGFAAGDANLYRYVGNGPTTKTDPSGLEPPNDPPYSVNVPISNGPYTVGNMPPQQPYRPPLSSAVRQERGMLGDAALAAYLGFTEAGRIASYPLRWVGVDFSEQDRCQNLLWDESGVGSQSGTRTVARVGGGMMVAGTGGATLGPRVVGGVRIVGGRIITYAGIGAQEAAIVGTLTGTQIQNLIQSSGNRVVPLFTRLSQSPAANRLLYTATNPKLCDQVQTNAGRTQIYAARIPYDLFQRLKFENLIRIEQTQMGSVTDEAYLIEAEAMTILQQYFQATGGDGLP